MTHKVFILWMLAAMPGSLAAEGWTQWRGAGRDGKVGKSAGAWPGSISEGQLERVWKVDLAESYASPILAGGKVFSVETRDAGVEVARAFGVEAGEEIWNVEWEGAMKVPFFAAKNGSWVRSTPATDGRSIFVGGMRDVLVSLDVETGEETWRVDFPEREETELPSFGYASSPLIDGDAIYTQAGMAVVKIDKATGETVWRALEDRRAMFASAFSSPVIATIQGVRQLVVQTRMELVGLDLEDGKKLWSTPVEAFRGMNILTPTVMGNRIFTATYGGGSFLFEIEAGDGGWKAREVWRDKKLEGYMSSPLAIGDHLYLLGRDKKFYCLEAATGKVSWVTKEVFGEYWSMVANGNRVLALDQRGELILFDADPGEFKLIERREISAEPTWAHLAVEGDMIFVRGLKSLAAYRWGGKAAVASAAAR